MEGEGVIVEDGVRVAVMVRVAVAVRLGFGVREAVGVDEGVLVGMAVGASPWTRNCPTTFQSSPTKTCTS